MTEAEWLAATDWRTIHRRVRRRKNYGRKIRLFSVACCRRIAHMFQDPRSDEALAVSELFADGLVKPARRQRVEQAARDAIHGRLRPGQAWARDAPWRTSRKEEFWEGAESCLRALDHDPAELVAQTALFREVFGNPFRRVKRERSWLTSDVLALARGIYDDKAFDRMPILADALQDAGCVDDDILNHCRDANQSHVRGCWVVDLLLGNH